MNILLLLQQALIRLPSLIALTLTLCFYSSTSNADEDTSVVVLFGDSISLGWNYAYIAQFGTQERRGDARQMHGEPSIQLSALLNDSLRKSVVLNDGWGGTASGGEGEDSEVFAANNGVSRVTNDLLQIKTVYPEADYKDFYALIIYGTNDYAFSIGPSTTGFNIQLIINAAKAQGFIPVVGTIPPCTGCGFVASQVNSFIANAVISTNTNTSPVYFADHYSKLNPNWANLTDEGVHPNDAGYLVIAENWFDTVLESLIDPFDANGSIIPPILQLLLDE